MTSLACNWQGLTYSLESCQLAGCEYIVLTTQLLEVTPLVKIMLIDGFKGDKGRTARFLSQCLFVLSNNLGVLINITLVS